MKTKGQANVMLVIMITVILAMVSISVVWGIIRQQQDTTLVANDTFTALNETCVRITDLCITRGSTSNITNATTDVASNFSECGATGSLYGYITVNGTVAGLLDHNLNATYTEEACGRITGITGTIIDYIPLLMAVIILVFVSMFAIK